MSKRRFLSQARLSDLAQAWEDQRSRGLHYSAGENASRKEAAPGYSQMPPAADLRLEELQKLLDTLYPQYMRNITGYTVEDKTPTSTLLTTDGAEINVNPKLSTHPPTVLQTLMHEASHTNVKRPDSASLEMKPFSPQEHENFLKQGPQVRGLLMGERLRKEHAPHYSMYDEVFPNLAGSYFAERMFPEYPPNHLFPEGFEDVYSGLKTILEGYEAAHKGQLLEWLRGQK